MAIRIRSSAIKYARIRIASSLICGSADFCFPIPVLRALAGVFRALAGDLLFGERAALPFVWDVAVSSAAVCCSEVSGFLATLISYRITRPRWIRKPFLKAVGGQRAIR
ncbi:MAG: hypothetical protein QOH24_1756 [Verrucomicrobiota bacterium]